MLDCLDGIEAVERTFIVSNDLEHVSVIQLSLVFDAQVCQRYVLRGLDFDAMEVLVADHKPLCDTCQ